MPLEPGTPAPDFGLLSHTRKPLRLSDLEGEKSVIVFMPFPFTSTCTAEACSLRDRHSELSELGARVAMITTHAMPTNAEWARQHELTFDILADYWPHGAVCQAYDAFDERSGFARRVTYFLDADAVIRDVVTSEYRDQRDDEAYSEILARI